MTGCGTGESAPGGKEGSGVEDGGACVDVGPTLYEEGDRDGSIRFDGVWEGTT